MTDTIPARDRFFALIASIPGSGTVDWCGPARALLDEIAAPAVVSAAGPPTQAALRDRIRLAIAQQFLDEVGAGRNVDELDDSEFGTLADAVLAVLPAPADRAAVLREAADVAREEAHRLETGNHDARAARGARSVAYLLRRLAEAPQPETEAEPEFTEARAAFMQIGRTPSLEGLRAELRIEGWPPVVGCYCGASMGRMHDVPGHEHLLAVDPRLIFEYAEDTPAVGEQPEMQDTPREPHPTEADMRHALAVLDRFHGRDTDQVAAAPVGGEQPAEEPMFGVPGCTCRPFTRQTNPARYLDQPGDTVDMISGWTLGDDCPHHRPAVVGQPGTQAREADRVVAYRSKGGRLLRCTAHHPGQRCLDSGDFHPVTSEDLPDGGTCTMPGCGVDVLIAADCIGISRKLCPGFPDRCPNLRTVEPNPPEHLGGIRCGCADAAP
ncbi:hypothetical protein OG352_05290 [Streptomyces sp. NBC_01485]|uniref:hypothetical protein n=1 Tax=Streptomyces sp. NBC_01485 TaxID=2903884 RepID=UPI002E2FDE17|nr:hypothetical protein [Streptomyces sp. NBC_01485]